MTENELMSLIEQYTEKFGEGPPVFGMEEEESCRKLQEAIESGRKITDTPDQHLPDDAIM